MSWADPRKSHEKRLTHRGSNTISIIIQGRLGGQSAPVDGPLPLFSRWAICPLPNRCPWRHHGSRVHKLLRICLKLLRLLQRSPYPSYRKSLRRIMRMLKRRGLEAGLSLCLYSTGPLQVQATANRRLTNSRCDQFVSMRKILKAEYAENMKVYWRDLSAWQGQKKSIMGMKINDGGDRAAMDERRRRLDEIGPEPETSPPS